MMFLSDIDGATTYREKLQITKAFQDRHPERGKRFKTFLEQEHMEEVSPNNCKGSSKDGEHLQKRRA